MSRSPLRFCPRCRKIYVKHYFHVKCPGSDPEATSMDKALKGWKKGRKGYEK